MSSLAIILLRPSYLHNLKKQVSRKKEKLLVYYIGVSTKFHVRLSIVDLYVGR